MSLPKTLEPQFELIEHFPGGKIFDCFRVKERKDKRPRELVLRLLPASFNDRKAVIDEFHSFFLKLSNLTNRSQIPIVYSVAGTMGGPVYVLEQYVSGITLPEYIEKHRNSEAFSDDLTEIVVRVCEGLHFAHQKDIFHCCITPDDILIDPDNPRKVKLVGFGTQILIKTGHLSTMSGSLEKLVAPEIASRGTIDTGCDIYSLATALSDACPEISFWNDLLAKSKSKDPSKRHSSAREFGRQLRKLSDTSNKQVAENESEDLIAGGLNPVLTIKTEPEGAEVCSDGQALGITSASGLMTPWKPGTTLEIKKTGYSTETLDLSAPPDNSEIIVKLNSALTLYTNPWGASVLVDGKHRGVTDRDGLMVPWDGSTIEIQKAGYRPEMLKFVAPPNENESSVELQPMVSSDAPKRHPLEVIGYAIGAIVLWLMPLVIYSGLSGGTGSSDGRTELLKELDDARRQISKLKSTEVEKQRLSKENVSLKSAADNWRQEHAAQKQIIASKDKEIASLKQKPLDPSKTVQDELTQLLKLAGSGDPAAQAELGEKYYKGEWVTRDYSQAFEWYKKSALKGNAHAQGRLAWMYDSGLGVGRDKTEAVKWYQKAAQQGDSFAENKLRTALSNAAQSQSQTTAGAQKPVVSGKNSFQPAQYSDLFSASSNGDLQTVERILAQGANPNARNSEDHTAIMIAAINGHFEVVKTLLKGGADSNLNYYGWTALDFAKKHNHNNIISLLSQHSGGRLPAPPSSSAKTSNDNLDIELISAASKGNTREVERLLKMGANPNTKNYGYTSLMWASYYDHLEVVKTLLNAGADRNLENPLGQTALDLAKQRNYYTIVSVLNSQSGGQPATPLPNQPPTISEGLGITIVELPQDVASKMAPGDRHGFVVKSVISNGIGAKMGLRPDDVILEVDGLMFVGRVVLDKLWVAAAKKGVIRVKIRRGTTAIFLAGSLN